MSKKDLILDSMLALLMEQKGATCSVSDIAKKAGIAKGGMYYYFRSKEEVFDALVDRIYTDIINNCKKITLDKNKNALEKLELFYKTYRSALVSSDVDAYLHAPQNANIHQKSLAKILTSLSPIITTIIEQGNQEGIFNCEYPLEVSEIILSVFCFLLDPGIFVWTPQQLMQKLTVLSKVIEKELGAPKNSMHFFIPQSL